MRLVYMGTPQFAVAPLRALVEAGHEIAGVVTRVDKPAGRGRTMAAPAVKQFAQEHGLAVYQPKRVREPDFVETLRQLAPEAVVVAAYGQILPKAILSLPRYGCINIHASLLPAYRGAAPINWAIVRGDPETGITIMQMDEGMDTGGILLRESLPIQPDDTAGTLTEKLSGLGARMIATVLPKIASGELRPKPQEDQGASVAPLLKKEDGLINWELPAVEIHNRVRGLTPWPGAYTFLSGTMIKILKTAIAAGSEPPGTVLVQDRTLLAGTGSGLLRIVALQPAGRKPMPAEEFLRGHRDVSGKKFEAPVSKP